MHLVDARGETIQFDEPHNIAGGTYAVGGTTEAWFNITYNYSPILTRVLKMPFRNLEGMRAGDTIPLLRVALMQLGTDVHENYWEPTEGNVARAVQGLIDLAEAAPDGIWRIT